MTDQRELATALLGHLEQLAALMEIANARHPSLVYRSTAALVLAHGQAASADERTFRGRRMRARACYRNAALRALGDPALTYVEGFCWLPDLPIPIPHAWNRKPDGAVADLTIRPRPGLAGGVYFGIAFQTSYLASALANQSHYGLLERTELYQGRDPADWKAADGEESP
jgi:hypothetical protein